jgi:hypothetical protein
VDWNTEGLDCLPMLPSAELAEAILSPWMLSKPRILLVSQGTAYIRRPVLPLSYSRSQCER